MIYNETNSISYHNKSYYLLLNIDELLIKLLYETSAKLLV